MLMPHKDILEVLVWITGGLEFSGSVVVTSGLFTKSAFGSKGLLHLTPQLDRMGFAKPDLISSGSENSSSTVSRGCICQSCQTQTKSRFHTINLLFSFLLQDKHSPVRTSGLKSSTLKQLGQSVLQPSSISERKVRVILAFPNAYSLALGFLW